MSSDILDILKERDQLTTAFDLNVDANTPQVFFDNDIRLLPEDSYSSQVIRHYFDNSRPHMDVQIKQIWSVNNFKCQHKFVKNGYDQKNTMLLWHGTLRSNLLSILQNNLQLPTAITHGHAFGSGIYFADRVAESLYYTDGYGAEVLLLCQVSVGNIYRVMNIKKFDKPPDGYDSIQAVGRIVPDHGIQVKLCNDYMNRWMYSVPCGPNIEHPDPIVRKVSPLYCNEFVAFDQDRVLIQFIVNCHRNTNSVNINTI